MKKTVTLLSLTTLLFTNILKAQDSQGGTPYSIEHNLNDNLITTVATPDYDYSSLIAMSETRVKQGTYPITDKLFDVSYNLNNSGTWTTLDNGDRLWKLKITSPGAVKILLYYQGFYLPKGAKLFVYNGDRSETAGAFTSANNDDANVNSGIISTPHLSGDTQIVEYYEPANVKGQGHFSIFRVAHQLSIGY